MEDWKKRFTQEFTRRRPDGYYELINLHAPDYVSFISEELANRTREVIEEIEMAHEGYDMWEDFDPSEPMLEKLQQLREKYGIK